LRKFFSVSKYAPATQRSAICPSRQRLTFPVGLRTPDFLCFCGNATQADSGFPAQRLDQDIRWDIEFEAPTP
jgi:hypothetical protein